MHSLRRAAFRSAIAASKQFASRSAATSPFTSQIATKLTARQSAVLTARSFSQTARSQNDAEEPKQPTEPEQATESAPDAFEAKEAEAAATKPAPEPTVPEGVEAATDADALTEDMKRFGWITPHALFVRNIIFDATEDDVATAFSKYGEVAGVKLVLDSQGVSRGHGFVYYKTAEAAQDAIANVNNTFWHGRRIEVKERVKESRRNPDSVATPKAPTRNLFIGNIPYDTTDAELDRLFRSLDNVVNVRVAVDMRTGWPRGFAHVDFTNVSAAMAAKEKLGGMRLGERTLRVDFANGLKHHKSSRGKFGGEAPVGPLDN